MKIYPSPIYQENLTIFLKKMQILPRSVFIFQAFIWADCEKYPDITVLNISPVYVSK